MLQSRALHLSGNAKKEVQSHYTNVFSHESEVDFRHGRIAELFSEYLDTVVRTDGSSVGSQRFFSILEAILVAIQASALQVQMEQYYCDFTAITILRFGWGGGGLRGRDGKGRKGGGNGRQGEGKGQEMGGSGKEGGRKGGGKREERGRKGGGKVLEREGSMFGVGDCGHAL